MKDIELLPRPSQASEGFEDEAKRAGRSTTAVAVTQPRFPNEMFQMSSRTQKASEHQQGLKNNDLPRVNEVTRRKQSQYNFARAQLA